MSVLRVDIDLKVGSDVLWLIIGGGCYFISNRLSNIVFASVSPTLAAVWMSTEPIIALVISALFLGACPNACEFVGGGILLGAAVCKSWRGNIEEEIERKEQELERIAPRMVVRDGRC